MLFLRRAAPGALLAASASAALAAFADCSAPDARGLFDPVPGPNNTSGSFPPTGCVERCRVAAARCTLVDAPCDALCGATGLSDAQLSCLATSPCEGSQSLLQRCLDGVSATSGFLGAACDCDGPVTCPSTCLRGLSCLDPGGPDGADGLPLFPGFCSQPCAPPNGSCPAGFVCRQQFFNGVVVAGPNAYWCER